MNLNVVERTDTTLKVTWNGDMNHFYEVASNILWFVELITLIWIRVKRYCR